MKQNKALIAHLSMFGSCAGWGLMAPVGKDAMTHGFDGISMVTFITGSDEKVDAIYHRLKAMENDCVTAGPYFDRYNHYKIETVDPEGNTIAFSD